MPLPDYQAILRPLLQFADKKKSEITTSEAVDSLAKEFKLTDSDLKEMLPSGTQSTFVNRVSWSSTYLKKAALLEPTRRGYYKITTRGSELLKMDPGPYNISTLMQYPEFREFRQLKGARSGNQNGNTINETSTISSTPTEALDEAYFSLRDELADELLTKLKQSSPAFFERTVVDMLVKMGYGGSLADAGRAVGKSGDGGIDGIIKEDKLGLDVIYIQAKRWDSNPVGRPDVMQFAGALQAKKANKGVFITTSRFTEDAKEYVDQIGSKIVLIDGEQLCDLMIEHDVGVSTVQLYPVKKIDSDYFDVSI